MIAGVYTVILAAVTAALPFTPPAGWVQLPRSAFSAHVQNVWKGAARGESFSTVTMPFPGSIDGFASALQARKQMGPVQVVSNVAATVCGEPARMITLRTAAGAHAMIVQQQIAVKNGYGYVSVYSRPASTAADPSIVAAMKSFCPTGEETASVLTPPKGWSASGSFAMDTLGMWMGTHPGEMMMLAGVQQPIPLEQIAGHLGAAAASPEAKKYVTLVSENHTTLCGSPALIVNLQMNMPGFPMSVEQVVAQNGPGAYLLNYVHPTSVAPDPAAQQSLRTLCPVTSGSPAPASSPSPLPRA